MNHNDKYVDIYSHTLQNNKNVTKKSRGRLKSILCFFVLFILIATIYVSYLFGAYLSRKTNIFTPTVNQQTSNDIITNGDDATLGNIIDCVVGICIYNQDKISYATGTLISDDGYILTNDHIFAGIESARVVVFDNKRNYYKAAFIGGDIKYDVAILKIEATSLDHVDLNSSSIAIVGEKVYCVGCPIDESLSFTVTSGIVSGTERRIRTNESIYPCRLIQTDAAINPGCSGGVLTNSKGQIIGLNCSKIVAESFEGLGFAIPIDSIKPVIIDLIEVGQVENRAQLGITYSCNEYIHSLAEGTTSGIVINSIKPMSDLYGKGVEVGDIIISINGTRIYREGDFLDVIEECSPNDVIRLTISSKDKVQFDVSVSLIAEKSKTSYIG